MTRLNLLTFLFICEIIILSFYCIACLTFASTKCIVQRLQVVKRVSQFRILISNIFFLKKGTNNFRNFFSFRFRYSCFCHFSYTLQFCNIENGFYVNSTELKYLIISLLQMNLLKICLWLYGRSQSFSFKLTLVSLLKPKTIVCFTHSPFQSYREITKFFPRVSFM